MASVRNQGGALADLCLQDRRELGRCSRQGGERAWENAMKLQGRCYCGKVRYVAEGEPILKAQCHCRECQYISGGAPNMFLLVPRDGFRYSEGRPAIRAQRSRTRRDAGILRRLRHASHHAATGSFCRNFESRHARRSECLRRPADGDLHHRQADLYHIPDGLPTFERLPPR